MGSPRSHSERPRWKASHLSAFRLRSCRPAVTSLRKLARHSAHESGLVDMSALATRRKCDLFTEKNELHFYIKFRTCFETSSFVNKYNRFRMEDSSNK